MKSKATFKQGSTVSMTTRFAKVLNKAPRSHVQWMGRKGMVVHCGVTQVAVIWDGRSTLDYVPIKALRLAVVKVPEPV